MVATNAYWIAEVANQTLERVAVSLAPNLAAADKAIQIFLASIPTSAEVYVIDDAAKVGYRVDHVAIDRDHASPLALLLSELIINAFKYAWPFELALLMPPS